MPGKQDNPVSINQLHLHCGAAQRATVMDALDCADWPDTADREIIVLRRLEIESEPWAIGKEAAARVRYLIGKTASPWGIDAAQAETVVFADQADYVAYLCRELLHPSASSPWFLNNHPLVKQVTALPLSSALASTLLDDPLLLPAAIEQLIERDLATEVLRAVGSRQLDKLTEQLLYTTGFSVDLGSLQEAPVLDDTDSTVQTTTTDIAVLDSHEKQRWVALLNRLPASLAESTASLAAVLVLWDQLPHILLQRDLAASAVARIRRQLLDARLAQRPSVHPRSQPDDLMPEARPNGQPENMQKRRERGLEQYPPETPPTLRDVPTRLTGEEQAKDSGQSHFFTSRGGCFYLLNLLRQPAFLAAFERSEHSAWRHLYLVCVVFGIELDDPLLAFIARQLQLDNAEDLGTLQVTETDRRLAGLTKQRIGHQAFWPEGLIHRKARVHYDRTHIDVDFHSSSVSLEIRLAGLDVNPGWLPWLGRVVHFHYLDDPSLLGGSS